jgi:uncharacterized damage-inducible protein DinB
MITPEHVRLMAAYNAWQNQSIYGAAASLGDVERKRDRAAFFGSIHATLNHLLWGDQLWMHRFTGSPPPGPANIPESRSYYDGWEELVRERAAFDGVISAWAGGLDPAWLDGDLEWYSGAAGRTITMPKWKLVTHMFNHQTHHRGQVHCMLTQAGALPDDTDIPLMPAP